MKTRQQCEAMLCMIEEFRCKMDNEVQATLMQGMDHAIRWVIDKPNTIDIMFAKIDDREAKP